MKLRSLLCTLLPLISLPLVAQDQTQAVPPAPLQIQENPVPPPAPPSAPPADSNAAPSVPADTNASAQPTPNALVPGPAPTNSDPSAPGPNSGMGSPGQNPPPSDPNSLIPPPVESQQPSPINTAGDGEKQRQDQKARYYSAKVKADKDDDLSSLLDQADKAKSDEAKRQALREYYDLLAKRMKKIDSSISDWIDTMHAAYLRRLEQVRVEPTIPMNLPPAPASAPDASPSPTPSATPKKKHRGHSHAASAPSSKKKADTSDQ